MQYPKIKVIIPVLIAIVSSTAFAAKDTSRAIDRLDTDGDKLISIDEFQSSEGRRGGMMLKRADLNNDGMITLAEMNQARDERMARHQRKMADRQASVVSKTEEVFAQMDADEDGMVTKEEMRLYAFNRIDENQDGYLSAEEFSKAHKHGRMKRDRKHRRMGDV